MSIPEGYSLLARVGFVDRGNYSASATYLAGDVVYYNGSTWSALKDNLKGVPPTNGANWRYMARGFASEVLSAITAKDTSGLVGTAGASVGAQELMDAIADKVATKLLLKTDLVSQIVNDATKAASMAALYAVNQKVDQQNSDLDAVEADLATARKELTEFESIPVGNWGMLIRSGKQVSLHLNANISVAIKAKYTWLEKIPEALRPRWSVYTGGYICNGSRVLYPLGVEVHNDGEVMLYSTGDDLNTSGSTWAYRGYAEWSI